MISIKNGQKTTRIIMINNNHPSKVSQTVDKNQCL